MPILRPITTRIDAERCTGCGLCVKVCPSRTLSLVDGKATITGKDSLNCGHCAAICPVQAITIESTHPDALRLTTCVNPEKIIPQGSYDATNLMALFRSRRSARQFTGEAVPLAVLEDLCKFGQSAPSGTNSLAWRFTLIPTRPLVLKVGDAVMAFFKKLNGMAEKPMYRLLAKLFMGDALSQYYHSYYESVVEAVRDYEEKQIDRLFHGAASLIVISTTPEASCPKEDALLAAGQILLAAHALGYGTCLIGFAVEAAGRTPEVKAALGVPHDEVVHAVIAVGTSREHYLRFTERPLNPPRIVTE